MMEHSDNIADFAAAMAKVQAEIGKAVKDAENPAFKRGNRASKYADLSAVWDAWQPIGPSNGFAVMQFPGVYDPEAKTMGMDQLVTHSSGQWVRGDMSIPLSKVDAQGYGSACTYARRYALSAAVGICPEDDDGNGAVRTSGNGAANDRTEASEKVPGIHKIKERLRALQTVGNADITLEKFNELVRDNADDLTKIKEANHSWWTGDGEDFEGFKAWIVRRRAELSEPAEDGQFAMLVASMKECQTLQALTNWMAANEAIIEQLDGAESRKFQLAYELHESAVLEMAKVTAG